MARTIDGDEIPDELITFDADTYHFTRGNTDITDDLPRSEKIRLVPGFDVEKENYRLSAEKGHGAKYGTTPLDTGVIAPAIDNIITDPFSAPIDALSNTANKFFGASGIIKILIFGALIFGCYILIAGGWFKRR